MEDPSIETGLRGRRDRREAEYDEQVPAHAVVLVDGLGVIYASVDARGVVLRYAHDGLDGEEDVCDETEDAVWGGEVGGAVGEFVVFDYDEGGEEG